MAKRKSSRATGGRVVGAATGFSGSENMARAKSNLDLLRRMNKTNQRKSDVRTGTVGRTAVATYARGAGGG
jgi:hypothetical protein